MTSPGVAVGEPFRTNGDVFFQRGGCSPYSGARTESPELPQQLQPEEAAVCARVHVLALGTPTCSWNVQPRPSVPTPGGSVASLMARPGLGRSAWDPSELGHRGLCLNHRG